MNRSSPSWASLVSHPALVAGCRWERERGAPLFPGPAPALPLGTPCPPTQKSELTPLDTQGKGTGEPLQWA